MHPEPNRTLCINSAVCERRKRERDDLAVEQNAELREDWLGRQA
jgi:hypothetical protein